MSMASKSILLESGTNEVEILEFVLDGQPFGVNVLKIQAIEQYDPSRVTRIQLCHEAVVGTLLFRDSCITLVDLAREMDTVRPGVDHEIQAAVDKVTAPELSEALPAPVNEDADTASGTEEEPPTRLVLVMEFNDVKTAFLVDGVNRIHRTSWESIHSLSPFLSSVESKFTGSLQIEDREILLVDMEKVVAEILPGGMDINLVVEDPDHPLAQRRADQVIFLAEDSAIISAKVVGELKKGNYQKVRTFPNGRECYEAISALVVKARQEGRPVQDDLSGVISDIEMPVMDGLAMCRNIKESLNLTHIPVIMFSSLINDQVARKCEKVGADDFISKPQFNKLIELLDRHCLNEEPSPTA